MTPRDYREAWAWVHLLLADSQAGKPLLIDYLNQGRAGSEDAAPLPAPRRARDHEQTLLAHLESVQSRVMARQPEPPSQDRLIRFQDRPAELQDLALEPAVTRVAPAPAPRPSLLRRIGSFLGL